MNNPLDTHRLDTVVRTIATAGKTLRLYPVSSPLPRLNVEAAVQAIDDFFAQGDPVVALSVTREGLSAGGRPLSHALGAGDLIERLRDHAVAEVAVMPGCSTEELMSFLTLLERDPDEVRTEGGLGSVSTSAGIESIRVSDVHLTVLEEAAAPAADEDLDEFLRGLVADEQRLAAWFAAASAGDPSAFEEGLMELVRVSGPSGYEGLLKSLSGAFLGQGPDGKDALIRLAMDPGPARDLTGGVFAHLGSGDIAGAVLGGDFGRNMLSLSAALTRLPLEQVTAKVRAEVQAMLPGSGHTSKEAAFLDHMLKVRDNRTPEPALVDRDRTYRAVAEAADLSDEVIEKARKAVSGSAGVLPQASVRTLLTLLDQQDDFELYCETAMSLAALVPRLLEQGDLGTASRVLTELTRRESAPNHEWPNLSVRIGEALEVAGGPRAMSALIKAVVQRRDLLDQARGIVCYASEQGAPALVSEAVGLKAEGLAVAEQLMGRRIVDQLNRIANQLQWYQLGPVVARLSSEGDLNSAGTIDALMRRPDEQSRREVLSGIAQGGGPLAQRVLETGLRDASSEVAVLAARHIGKSGWPHAATVLIKRLGELDLDNADFAVAREIIAGISRLADPAVDAELARLARRRALLKRGHYGEIQDLVRQAQELRRGGGAR